MHTGAGVKTAGDWNSSGSNVDTWSCGCTVVGSRSLINARCLACGSVFKKMTEKKSGQRKAKTESRKMEVINNTQPALPDAGAEERETCQRCENTGEIKVFTQEWDMIKSHTAPCPICLSREWNDWAAGRRIIDENK